MVARAPLAGGAIGVIGVAGRRNNPPSAGTPDPRRIARASVGLIEQLVVVIVKELEEEPCIARTHRRKARKGGSMSRPWRI
jgi:hypothetical protein